MIQISTSTFSGSLNTSSLTQIASMIASGTQDVVFGVYFNLGTSNTANLDFVQLCIRNITKGADVFKPFMVKGNATDTALISTFSMAVPFASGDTLTLSAMNATSGQGALSATINWYDASIPTSGTMSNTTLLNGITLTVNNTGPNNGTAGLFLNGVGIAAGSGTVTVGGFSPGVSVLLNGTQPNITSGTWMNTGTVSTLTNAPASLATIQTAINAGNSSTSALLTLATGTVGNLSIHNQIATIVPGTIGGTRPYWLTINDSANNAVQSAYIRLADSVSGISMIYTTGSNGMLTTVPVLNDVTMWYWGNKPGYAPIAGTFLVSATQTASTLTMTSVVLTAPTSSSYGTVGYVTTDQSGAPVPLSVVKWVIQDPSNPMVVWSGSSQSDTSAVWQLPVAVGHGLMLTVGSGASIRSFSYGPVVAGVQWIT